MKGREEEVDAWFDRLVAQAPEQRDATFAALGREAPELVHELRTLLEAHSRSVGPIDELAVRMSSSLHHRSREHETIGQYQVGPVLGEGGMGVVHRGRDTRLERDVALKFLPPWLGRDPGAKERLISEARAASGLDHPNICTVYGIEETPAGDLFLVMPLYEGKTLAAHMECGALPGAEALAIARQAALGLAAAHAHGVVHRDIKPSNLLITTSGVVKVLDFGIAKVGELHLTRTGERVGTLQYMAPEQIAGDAVDGRADLWALGVVLHEMLTGARPQVGRSSADSLRLVEPRVGAIVAQLLEPDPAARFASADALIAAIDAVPGDTKPQARRSRLAMSAGLGTLAVAGAVAWLVVSRPAPAPAEAFVPASDVAAMGVAVLPFRVVGEDAEFWREGIVDLLSFNVDGLGGLRKVDPHAVLALWRQRIGAGVDAPTLGDALDVAHALGAAYAITGSVLRLDSMVRLTVDVHDLATGTSRGSTVVDGGIDALFGLVDGLALNLVQQQLLPVARETQVVALERVTTSSVPALKAYLEGEAFYRHGRWLPAADAYRRAIAIDTTFARAYLRLAFTLPWANDSRGATENLAHARRHGERLGIRDRRLAEAVTVQQLAAFVAQYPDDPEGWTRYGDAAFHQGIVHLLPAETFRMALENAVRLLPHYGEAYTHLLEDAMARRDSAATFRLLALQEGPDGMATNCATDRFLAHRTWGSDAGRAAAAESLAVLPTATLRCGWTAIALDPASLDRVEASDRERMLPGLPNVLRALGLWRSVQARTLRGEADAAISILDHADSLPVISSLAAHLGTMLHLSGRIDARTAERYRARLLERNDFQDDFWLGALAVRDGDWAAVERQAARIDSAGPLPPGADGVTPSRLADALREYAAMVRGDLGRLQAFEAALATLPTASVRYEHPPVFLRHAVGQLLLGRGELDAAARYARTTNHYEWIGFVPAQLILGQWHEARGETRAARVRYALAADWLRDAGPAFHPARDSARAGVARTSGQRGH